MNNRDLSADQKYYASGQPSALHSPHVENRTRTKQASRRPLNNGVDSTDKYYANNVEFVPVQEASTLPAVTGETDSISDVSDIVRVLDTVATLFSAGTTSVRIPVMADLLQKARTNLELRVGREELTSDQAASVDFVLLDTASPVKEEEPEAVVEVVEQEVEEDGPEEEEVVNEEPEEVEAALTSEDLLDVLNEDDTPSIASLFGATDDDGDD